MRFTTPRVAVLAVALAVPLVPMSTAVGTTKVVSTLRLPAMRAVSSEGETWHGTGKYEIDATNSEGSSSTQVVVVGTYSFVIGGNPYSVADVNANVTIRYSNPDLTTGCKNFSVTAVYAGPLGAGPLPDVPKHEASMGPSITGVFPSGGDLACAFWAVGPAGINEGLDFPRQPFRSGSSVTADCGTNNSQTVFLCTKGFATNTFTSVEPGLGSPAKFTGSWKGSYSLSIDTLASCGILPAVAGSATLTLQQHGDYVTGQITVPGAYVYWNSSCQIYKRANTGDSWRVSLEVIGTDASGDGMFLTTEGGTVLGGWYDNGKGGRYTFRFTR